MMLVTRPEPDAQQTLMRLHALGIAAEALPMLSRQRLDTAIPSPDRYAALALTSANALRALADRGGLEAFRHLPVYAVGTKTAHDAETAGFVEVHDAAGDLADLVQIIAQAGIEGPVFHPAPLHQSGDLAQAMALHGIVVDTVPLYEMVARQDLPETVLENLESRAYSAALFYSRRTAEAFVGALEGHLSQHLRLGLEMLCLSETIAKPLVEAHFTRISLADMPHEDAMMSLALAFAREQNRS